MLRVMCHTQHLPQAGAGLGGASASRWSRQHKLLGDLPPAGLLGGGVGVVGGG
jgi:hypothetical protein